MENIEQTPAPAEPTPIVEADAPIEPAPPAEKPEKPRSIRDSLEKAFDAAAQKEGEDGADKSLKQEGSDKDAPAAKGDKKPESAEGSPPKTEKTPETAKTEQKPEPKPDEGRPRGEDGKFVKKDGEEQPEGKPADRFTDAPARFSNFAKEAWKDAPEAVRAETQRAIQEIESGLTKYQEQMAPFQPFLQMADGDAGKVAAAMNRLVNAENLIRQNPAQGFANIAQTMGYSREQLAKMLMNEDPGQPAPPDRRDQQIAAMGQEISKMRQALGGVHQTIEQQKQSTVVSEVQQFAKDHPRFDELSEPIAEMLTTGFASDLPDAYRKAELLNPAPAPDTITPATPAAPAQTRQPRSLTGAPSPGSNPTTNRTPAKSPREALQRAFGA